MNFAVVKRGPGKSNDSIGYQGRLYIVENVDAEVCQECGERYFHATTLDAINRHLSMEHEVKERMNVEVVDMVA